MPIYPGMSLAVSFRHIILFLYVICLQREYFVNFNRDSNEVSFSYFKYLREYKMRFKRTASFLSTSVIFLLMTISCSTVDVYQIQGSGIGHGPPAHARAHGYRRKQVAGLELVFDSSLGLFVVVGHPDHYYCDGYFYRLSDSMWERSQQPDRGWTCVSDNSIPMGLKAKGKNKRAY